MRIPRSVIFVLAASILLLSCGSDDGGGKAAPPDSPLARLDLDNGRKWQVDDHTREMFARMTETLADSDRTSVEALKSTGEQMQGQIQELIAGCTMEGAGHDHLHVILGSYIPAVNSLADTGDPASATEVERILDTYSEFFE